MSFPMFLGRNQHELNLKVVIVSRFLSWVVYQQSLKSYVIQYEPEILSTADLRTTNEQTSFFFKKLDSQHFIDL